MRRLRRHASLKVRSMGLILRRPPQMGLPRVALVRWRWFSTTLARGLLVANAISLAS